MRSPTSLKQEFLRKWLKGLQVYSTAKKEMSVMERKNVIKLSADVAMASTRISTSSCSSWSRAIMAKAAASNKKLMICNNSRNRMMIRSNSKRVRSKKILRKSCSSTIRRMRIRKAAAAAAAPAHGKAGGSVVAKRLIMKRTEMLKRLVPGGEFMDEISLMRETLDYIFSLRLQVDVMRHLANASHKLFHPS